jgi:hypothetical protein
MRKHDKALDILRNQGNAAGLTQAAPAALDTAASEESRPAATDPDASRIAALAYQLWVERGSPDGSDQEDWYRAEDMLKSRNEETGQELADLA